MLPDPCCLTRSHLCVLPGLAQVHDHPGSFESYASRLVEAAPALTAAALSCTVATTKAASTAPGPLAGPGPVSTGPSLLKQPVGFEGLPALEALLPATRLHSAVVRGCVQLIAWARGLHGPAPPPPPPSSLLQLLPDVDAGLHASVSFHPGDGEGKVPQVQAHQVLPGAHFSSSSSSSAVQCGSETMAQLLMLSPPVLAWVSPPGAGGAAGAVRLLLHSPRPQPARVLVLVEWRSGGGCQEPQAPARLLREMAVELVGGPQEVELALGAGELAGAVGADGVGVLQLALVGPENNVVEEGSSAYPPMHFVAPPLLLLPLAAAGEVCGLWADMQRAAGERKAEDGDGNSCPQTDVGAPSSLWWSHLAPLLGDLAYVLGAGGQAHGGQESAATCEEAVSSHLLQYLSSLGLQATADLLQQQNAVSTPPPPSGSEAAASLPASSGGTSNPRPTGPFRSLLPAVAAALRRLLLLSPAPFTPPSLELSYQAWRLAGLAAAAPYVLLVTAQPFFMSVVCTALEHGVRHVWLTAILAALNWTGESCANLAMLSLLPRLRAHPVSSAGACSSSGSGPHSDPKKMADGAKGNPGARQGAHCKNGSEETRLVATGLRRHRVMGVLVGPVLLILTSSLLALGVLPYYVKYTGSVKVLALCTFFRSVFLPSIQQMSAAQVAAAAPLLAPGEAMQLAAFQPDWSWRAVVGAVAAWRLAAVVVAAAWERHWRRKFVALSVRVGQQGGVKRRGEGESGECCKDVVERGKA